MHGLNSGMTMKWNGNIGCIDSSVHVYTDSRKGRNINSVDAVGTKPAVCVRDSFDMSAMEAEQLITYNNDIESFL